MIADQNIYISETSRRATLCCAVIVFVFVVGLADGGSQPLGIVLLILTYCRPIVSGYIFGGLGPEHCKVALRELLLPSYGVGRYWGCSAPPVVVDALAVQVLGAAMVVVRVVQLLVAACLELCTFLVVEGEGFAEPPERATLLFRLLTAVVRPRPAVMMHRRHVAQRAHTHPRLLVPRVL